MSPLIAKLFTALLLVTIPALSQNYGQQQNRDQHYNNRNNQNFYNGVREGTRGGQYSDPRHAHDGYDDRYYQNQHHQGGIGPGKGALIGGAGGAALGALFGGGLKGTIIGGAAGAGIGAALGEANQNSRDRNNYPR
jgi:hypothetical protein